MGRTLSVGRRRWACPAKDAYRVATREGRRVRMSAGTSNKRELSFFKTMFSLALDWGWLRKNPTKAVKKIKGETKRLRILAREKIGRLIGCARVSLKPILMLADTTGMRKSEILNLK